MSERQPKRRRRTKGDGSLYKRHDGTWIGRIDLPTTDGKRRRKAVASRNRNEAMRKLRELKAAIEAGQTPGTGNIKTEVYLNRWLEDVHRKRCKPSTFPGDERTVHNYIVPFIGSRRLDRLHPQDVRNMITALQDTHTKDRKASTRSAVKAYVLLRRALGDAQRDGLIARNVTDAVDKPKHLAEQYPAFTPKVAIHIMRTADSYCDAMWAARWATGFMTGARESEILGLRWAYVDLDDDLIDISWQLQEYRKEHGCGQPVDGRYPCGKVRVSFCPEAHWDFPPGLDYELCERSLVWTRPKSVRSARGLPIIAPLHPILADLRDIDTGPNPHGLVFHHPDGAPFTQAQDQKAWRDLLVAAKVPHARQHTLRKTTATLLRAAQVDEATRMELFGHASVDVQRMYAGAELDTHRAAMSKLVDILTPELMPPRDDTVS